MDAKTQINGFRLVYSLSYKYWLWFEVIHLLNKDNEVISEQTREYNNPYLIRQGFSTIEEALTNAPQEVLNNLNLNYFPIVTFMTSKFDLSQVPDA